MKLSEMRQILSEHGIQLTKSLGQNFLHDANQLRRILAAADLTGHDEVLEIGPGLGPLTERLLASAGRVLAIEMDRRLIECLRMRFASAKNLELLHGDALEYLRQPGRDWRGWKVVSNLPYSVSSPILVELAQAEEPPRLIVVTLQLEVARRLMAREGQPDYGLLTLLVQLRYEPAAWFKIPSGCFFPEPEVDSACVVLSKRAAPLLSPDETTTFTRVIRRGFSQRRKMMLKLLKEDWPQGDLEAAFARTGLSARTRAEAVSLDQFVQLSRVLHDAARQKGKRA